MNEIYMTPDPERLKHIRLNHGSRHNRISDCDLCFLVAEINRRDAEIVRLRTDDESRIAAAVAAFRKEMMSSHYNPVVISGGAVIRGGLSWSTPDSNPALICTVAGCPGRIVNNRLVCKDCEELKEEDKGSAT